MKRATFLLSACLTALIAVTGLQAQEHSSMPRGTGTLSFVENVGQWSPQARYLMSMKGLNLWVTDNGFVYDIYHHTTDPKHPESDAQLRSGHVVRMNFVGTGTPSLAGEEAAPGLYNYIRGKDRSTWKTGVRHFSDVNVKNLYKGIDAAIYLENDKPRYDLIVAPGADPSQIRIAFDGARAMTVKNDKLIFSTSLGDLEQAGLFAYQMQDGRRVRVECSFIASASNAVKFDVGHYDITKPLVIDPLLYSTFIGGTDRDECADIAVDAMGNVYTIGSAYSEDFPTTTGAYQEEASDLPAVFVAKLSHDGSELLYATYIDGSNSDDGYGIAVDPIGNAFIAGATASDDFPTTTGAFQEDFEAGCDAFVAKLGPDGDELLYSTYLGSQSDDLAYDIALSQFGRVFVVGSTSGRDFPVTDGSAQDSFGGGGDDRDGFVVKLTSDLDSVLYGTFLGGDGLDEAHGVTVNGLEHAFVTGWTEADDFPTTDGAFQEDAGGGSDLFVTKIENDGSEFLYSTLVGGLSDEAGTDIAVDGMGNAHVTGWSSGNGYPVTQNAYQTFVGDYEAVVTKVNADGSDLLYSTYLAGAGNDWGNGIHVDALGNIYVTGSTTSDDFPVSAGAYSNTYGGGATYGDAFLTKFTADGQMLLYSSYIGGEEDDDAKAIGLDAAGNIYIGGRTWSIDDYPTTDGAFQTESTATVSTFVTAFPGIRVTSPNGGEELCGSSVSRLTWESTGIPTVDIYVSSDSGRTYTLLAQAVNGNTFDWPIPDFQQADTLYLIRIEQMGTLFGDASDSVFTIHQAPNITGQPSDNLQAQGKPATFTAVGVGEPQPTVQWQESTDLGETWADIPGAVNNTLTLPNLQASQDSNRYRAIFTNLCGSDTTNEAKLTVSWVRLLEPVGEEVLCAGTDLNIVWMSRNFASNISYNLAYSPDNGTTWNIIKNGVIDTQYVWTIPPGVRGSTEYLVRVRVNTGVTEDVIDQTFSVQTAASVRRDPIDAKKFEFTSVVFEAEGEGFPRPDAIWQRSTDGGSSWTDVQPTKVTNFENGLVIQLGIDELRVAQNGYMFRAIFSNGCGADTTRVATLSVEEDDPTSVNETGDARGALSIRVAPNPAREHAEAIVRLARPGMVRMLVSNSAGEVVAAPVERRMTAGEHRVTFDVASLPNGTYTCTVVTDEGRASVKMTVIR